MDELCDEGKLSRNYCLDCQSTNTKPLSKAAELCMNFHRLSCAVDFISHSASVLQLQFLYQVVLADKVKDKVIVDVGSRLGAVLYTVSKTRPIRIVRCDSCMCRLGFPFHACSQDCGRGTERMVLQAAAGYGSEIQNGQPCPGKCITEDGLLQA